MSTPDNTGDCRTCAAADGVVCRNMIIGWGPRNPRLREIDEWTENLEDDLMTRRPDAPPCPCHTPRDTP